MKNNYTIGKHEYSKCTVALSSALFVSGIGYGLATRKSPLGVLAFGLLGSIVGFSVGMIVRAPKRVIE